MITSLHTALYRPQVLFNLWITSLLPSDCGIASCRGKGIYGHVASYHLDMKEYPYGCSWWCLQCLARPFLPWHAPLSTVLWTTGYPVISTPWMSLSRPAMTANDHIPVPVPSPVMKELWNNMSVQQCCCYFGFVLVLCLLIPPCYLYCTSETFGPKCSWYSVWI